MVENLSKCYNVVSSINGNKTSDIVKPCGENE
jgi:hypothetical protein